jgi:hypothetical protein
VVRSFVVAGVVIDLVAEIVAIICRSNLAQGCSIQFSGWAAHWTGPAGG